MHSQFNAKLNNDNNIPNNNNSDGDHPQGEARDTIPEPLVRITQHRDRTYPTLIKP